MKILKKILLLIILCIPSLGFAISNDYNDVVKNYYDIEETDTVNIYLFYSYTCPHCKKEMNFFDTLKEKYKDKIRIYTYEVTRDKANRDVLLKLKKYFNDNSSSVPFTVIGNKYILGYDESYNDKFYKIIDEYLNEIKDDNNYNIPLLGKVNAKSTSIILVSVVLGLIDGFNPCAMWILLLLINMCISIKDKKKMRLICYTFIFSSGLIYLLSMLGIGVIIDLSTIVVIRNIIALLALSLGIVNIIRYFKTRKETGCHIVKKEKRKSIISKINNILNKRNIFLIIISTFILATSVNLIEMACSLGFPTIFLEILSLNKINGLLKLLYLIIYIFCYLIDDIVVLIISIKTFETKGISTKYNKYVTLIGGLLMVILGILLIFKPEWVMLNF